VNEAQLSYWRAKAQQLLKECEQLRRKLAREKKKRAKGGRA
jgi:hypothetical protein